MSTQKQNGDYVVIGGAVAAIGVVGCSVFLLEKVKSLQKRLEELEERVILLTEILDEVSSEKKPNGETRLREFLESDEQSTG